MEIDELKGQIWAVNFLVPQEEFLDALRTLGYPPVEKLAQYFGVTIDFIILRSQLSY